MISIIQNLNIFFEDCYKEFSVREYSRIQNISPPTASKLLKNLNKENILLMRKERGFLFFRINRENQNAKDLSKIYWYNKLNELIENLCNNLYPDSIVLFGSLSKLEATKESDIDLAIFTKSNQKTNLTKFEKSLKRNIQIFTFESLDKINKELKNNIINGYIVRGYLK